jgi:hypothetical protein
MHEAPSKSATFAKTWLSRPVVFSNSTLSARLATKSQSNSTSAAFDPNWRTFTGVTALSVRSLEERSHGRFVEVAPNLVPTALVASGVNERRVR